MRIRNLLFSPPFEAAEPGTAGETQLHKIDLEVSDRRRGQVERHEPLEMAVAEALGVAPHAGHQQCVTGSVPRSKNKPPRALQQGNQGPVPVCGTVQPRSLGSTSIWCLNQPKHLLLRCN